MTYFSVTRAAKNGLVGIAKFTQQHWGVEQRDRYLAQLDSRFYRLAGNPELGKQCDYIKPGYRKFPVGSHVIYYRICSNRIEIIRVLHKRMDVSESVFLE